jgi:hypothetical protein
MRTLFAIALTLALLAGKSQAGWIVDQAFTIEGFGAGSGVTQRLNSHDVDSTGRVHSVSHLFETNGSTTQIPPVIDPAGLQRTVARVGMNDETFILSLSTTGEGTIRRSIDAASLTPFVTLPAGQAAGQHMDIDRATNNFIVGVDDGDAARYVSSYNSAGSLLFTNNITSAIGLGRIIGDVAYDGSGNPYVSDNFGVMYAIENDGSLTATGDALSGGYTGEGIGNVRSMRWHDGAWFFGVQMADIEGVNQSAVLRLLNGATDIIAYGDGEQATDIAFFEDRLFIPNVLAGDSLVDFGSFASLNAFAAGDVLTVAVGDFNGELLGFASGPTPEPSSMLLLAGLLGISAWKDRRKLRGKG